MSEPRLVIDIRNQADSLKRVLHAYAHGATHDMLADVRQLLRETPTVVLTGMGASLFAAIPLEYELNARGIRAIAIDTAELLHFKLPLTRGAVVVIVSRSGESIEVERLLHALDDDTVTIGVTNEPESLLGQRATYVLPVPHHADELIAIQSYTSTLFLLAGLADERNEGELVRGIATVDAAVQNALSRTDVWNSFFEDAGKLYLLGRGPSLASCWEGCLLFGEVSKYGAIPMQAAQFRHGPIEVIDPSYRAIVFAPAGIGGKLNVSLAAEIQRLGGRSILIGSTCDGAKPDFVVPPSPAWLAPLLEVIPLQVAAMRLAQLQGFELGCFRAASHVTRSEAAAV